MPSSLDEQEGDQQEDQEEELDQRIQDRLANMEQAFQEAEANIAVAQKFQKETYDRNHQPQVLPEGTEVLLEITWQKQRKGGKLHPLWQGPYSIHRVLGNGLYELTNKEGKVIKNKANINHLKVYTQS